MTEYRTGVRCDECGCPIPSRNVLGGGLCDECWDAITARRWEEEAVWIEGEPCGQQFPDGPGDGTCGPNGEYTGRP